MTMLTGRRALTTLSALILMLSLVLGALGGPAGGAIRHRGAGSRVAKAAAHFPPAYDLVSALGAVTNLGGAGFYGQASSLVLKAPIVGIEATPDGKGYWLVGTDGGIFSYGDAHFYGSAGAIHLNKPIVGMAAGADGHGYWLVASDGGIFSYGDAHFHGSTGGRHLNAPIVGMASTADGKGYWLVASDGGIFSFGDAHFYGSAGAIHLNEPIVGMAAGADGHGYWLVASDGGIFGYGDAHFYGSGAGALDGGSVAGVAATPDGKGYWLTTAGGRVLAFGDAVFHGDLTGDHPAAATTGIATAMAVTPPPPSPYLKGSIGYDINWPQCQSGTSTKTVTLPGPPSFPNQTRYYTVAIVGVDGWAVESPNPCLTAEVAWAKAARGTHGASYSLYMLLNAPGSVSQYDATGPAGNCRALPSGSTSWQHCLAYNYGWNSAAIAFAYATSKGASAQVWWLDIENTACSNSNFNGGFGVPWSCDTTLNDLTLQGSMDKLHDMGVTVGVYSTTAQWAGIMGGYVPNGPPVPLWIAGAVWTTPPYPDSYHFKPESALAPWCAGSYTFAHGVPWILQETPGSTNYPFDPDYAC